MPRSFIGTSPLNAPSAASVADVAWTSNTTATITVGAPSDTGIGPITKYFATGISSDGSSVVTGESSTTTVNVTGLTAGVTYYFVASVSNGAGLGAQGSGSLRVPAAAGQAMYDTPGTYTWTCPTGVTSVSVVACGSGAGADSTNAGSAGGLGWINDYAVTPGTGYTVSIGVRGSTNRSNGGEAFFNNTSTCRAYGGIKSSTGIDGGTFTGHGGGFGGNTVGSNRMGGGGGPGYHFVGGTGGNGNQDGKDGRQGSGGGGGGGSQDGGGGGGVGPYGRTSVSGTGGTAAAYAGGGTGGSGGDSGAPYPGSATGPGSGNYGAGAGAGSSQSGKAFVRILWPGQTRRWPETNTADI